MIPYYYLIKISNIFKGSLFGDDLTNSELLAILLADITDLSMREVHVVTWTYPFVSIHPLDRPAIGAEPETSVVFVACYLYILIIYAC